MLCFSFQCNEKKSFFFNSSLVSNLTWYKSRDLFFHNHSSCSSSFLLIFSLFHLRKSESMSASSNSSPQSATIDISNPFYFGSYNPNTALVSCVFNGVGFDDI